MGLDMYLNKKTYVKRWDFQKPEAQHKVTVKLGGKVRKDIKPERIKEITEEVGYWRKANQIHQWFVKNVQDGKDECEETYLEREKLEELLETCETVLADHSQAEKLLPSGSGFFFGSTDYDEWYYQDLENTVKILKGVLDEKPPEGGYSSDYYYRSSW
mgnify:CR=1 FL=1